MWPSQPREFSSDSLTTVMVLAQKLKLHNPMLTAPPGMHEEICLQTTQKNNKQINSKDNIADSNQWERSTISTSYSSIQSSASSTNDEKTGEKNLSLQKKQQIPKTIASANQNLKTSISHDLPENKSNQTITGSSAGISNPPKKKQMSTRTLSQQKRPLLSQTAVDIDTENDTDDEISNDTESEEELKIFGMVTTSNSDYDDAFESVSDSSPRDDNGKTSRRLNLRSKPGNSYDRKQDNLRVDNLRVDNLRVDNMLSARTKPCKENIKSSKDRGKATTALSTTPPNSSSPLMSSGHIQSGKQNLGSKFCHLSPMRQRTGKKEANNNTQSLKIHPRVREKSQTSNRLDDGLGASIDDNEDDVRQHVSECRPDSLNVPVMRKKRSEGRKSRNLSGRRQGDVNGSDTSNTSSSSSLCYFPFTKVMPTNTSSLLSKPAGDTKHSDKKEQVKNCSDYSVSETTDFGQKLNLLQSELVQLRNHDETLARQFLQIYRDIQILKVQRACLDHQDLLDDAIDEVEDRDRLLDLCDIPPLKHSGSKLRHCGLTKMNICSRRFSCS